MKLTSLVGLLAFAATALTALVPVSEAKAQYGDYPAPAGGYSDYPPPAGGYGNYGDYGAASAGSYGGMWSFFKFAYFLARVHNPESKTRGAHLQRREIHD